MNLKLVCNSFILFCIIFRTQTHTRTQKNELTKHVAMAQRERTRKTQLNKWVHDRIKPYNLLLRQYYMCVSTCTAKLLPYRISHSTFLWSKRKPLKKIELSIHDIHTYAFAELLLKQSYCWLICVRFIIIAKQIHVENEKVDLSHKPTKPNYHFAVRRFDYDSMHRIRVMMSMPFIAYSCRLLLRWFHPFHCIWNHEIIQLNVIRFTRFLLFYLFIYFHFFSFKLTVRKKRYNSINRVTNSITFSHQKMTKIYGY